MRAAASVSITLAFAVAAAACCPKPPASPAEPAPPDPSNLPASVDAIAARVLATSKVPSAVVAVVEGGRVVYTHAYGDARLAPRAPATTSMRYSIGSISKQLTAAAILLLAEDGKLSLDDAVGRYVPGLTRGDEVTIRQILSHTSGYRDCAPQDYMIPAWEAPTTAQAIVDAFAKQPLDFEPGTQWQYSNTNYVIAGMIVERVTGAPLSAFLQARIFGPLHMTTIGDDAARDPRDAEGYFRRADGPAHVSPPMGKNWLYAAGDLSMTVGDLAAWDVALIAGSVLSPASAKLLGTEVVLANGVGTRYGLGVQVLSVAGPHRELEHGGETTGFVADNLVLPDDRLAVAVLTNQDASGAASDIASAVRDVLLERAQPASAAADARVRAALLALAAGRIDRARFTADANAYFTADAVREYASALGALGPLASLKQDRASLRGGFTVRRYTAKYARGTAHVSVFEAAGGAFEQLLITLES